LDLNRPKSVEKHVLLALETKGWISNLESHQFRFCFEAGIWAESSTDATSSNHDEKLTAYLSQSNHGSENGKMEVSTISRHKIS
jgi:hypothetical protein